MKKSKSMTVYVIIAMSFLAIITLCSFFLLSYLFKEEPAQINEIEIEVPTREAYTGYYNNCFSNYPYLKYEDNDYSSMFGIDVAAHQDIIDWQKVKEAGVEFAYIRLGYRGAVEGKLNIDEQFENNYLGATQNDIKVGIYWYSQPANEKELIEEANFVIEVLNGRRIDLPIAYDFEETEFYDGSVSRMHGMSKHSRTTMATSFKDIMAENNYETIIYTYQYWADNYYDWSRIDKKPLWFAQYKETPYFDWPVKIWQYSDSGEIDGIDTPVDLDIMFIQKNDQN